MKLSSLLHVHHIIPALQSGELHDAIPEMLHRVDRFRPGLPSEEIAAAVLRREGQSTTALAKGVAVPHSRIPGLQDFFILLGMARSPLKTTCLDGSPVDMVFLILSNDQKNTLMLQSMAAIGMLARDEEHMRAVREAETREGVWQAIDESSIVVKKTLQARDLMNPCAVSATRDTPMGEVIDLMLEPGLGAVVVLGEDGQIVGSVTSREIVDAGFPPYMARMRDLSFLSEYEPFEQFFKREAETLAGDLMNKEPLVVDVDDPMIQVVFRMKHDRHRIAFVQEKGRFVGIINRDDIISRILRA